MAPKPADRGPTQPSAYLAWLAIAFVALLAVGGAAFHYDASDALAGGAPDAEAKAPGEAGGASDAAAGEAEGGDEDGGSATEAVEDGGAGDPGDAAGQVIVPYQEPKGWREALLASPPTSVRKARQVLTYPTCVPGADPNATTEKDFVVAQLAAAQTFKSPWPSATYFCGIWPDELYKEMLSLWPPDQIFDNYETKKAGCGSGGCRYSLSGTKLLKTKAAVGRKKWKRFDQGVKLWARVRDIVFSKEFEETLWAKLGVSKPREKIKNRELRILSDKGGRASGRVHTDMDARKTATMMFYITTATKPVFDYGTCLHNDKQYKQRKMLSNGRSGRADGESECFYKFRYMPNSGYSFKVSPMSWHSAPNSRISNYNKIERNTLLVNWY